MTPADLAYVGGVVDVLASVGTRTSGDHLLPMVQVSTVERDLVAYLCEVSGIALVETRRNYYKGGCAVHCEEKHVHIVSTSHRWSLTGAKATIVLSAVRPWLRVKGGVADDAIGLGLAAPRKPATVGRMRDLGWPVDLPWTLSRGTLDLSGGEKPPRE